ncbi:unnamed protein product [Lota lota]
METVQELIPFVKEMLSKKPTRGMLKLYLVGSAFAVVGTVIGLVETVCHPFSGGSEDDAEMAMLMFGEPRGTLVDCLPLKRRGRKEEVEEEVQDGTSFETDQIPATLSKTHGPQVLRIAANRPHAS